MPHFDIIKKSEVETTFRVSKVMADFDVKPDQTEEHFIGTIEIPDEWSIGVIVGGSGTGKTSIAQELFRDQLVSGYEYTAKSVIDDMPKANVSNITKMFYSVGFGSVPSWLKPYSVLSNGEKMRVDLARAILDKDFVVFDEFTSVVDRQVAQTASLAINKAVRTNKKKFIAVSCHYDIIDWLEPDWCFDTNTMTNFFGKAHDRARCSASENAASESGRNLSVITI